MKPFLILILLAISSNVFSQCIVAEYPFNGNANDESGNGNNGTVNGATLTVDRFGNSNSAYYFDGTNYITATDLYSQSFTVNLWVKTTTDGIYFCKHYTSSLPNSSYIVYSASAASCQPRAYYTNQSSTPIDVVALDTICNDEWHMITATLDATNLKIYVDGVFQNQSAGGLTQLTTFSTLIGARYDNSGTVVPDFTGSLDDIKYFDCALSSQQVDSIWNIESSYCTVYDTIYVQDTTFITVTDTNYVTVTDTNYVTLYDTTYITVEDTLHMMVTTGLVAPNDNNTLLVYPNPSSTSITIDNGDYVNMNGFSVQIINTFGQNMFSSNINQQLFNVDVSSWPSGTYFIHIVNGSSVTIKTSHLVIN